MAEEEEDDDVFTIMVATDSHLGYCDRDAVRGTDSFAAFEEVLRLANDRGADFLLLAGDLFHDNKPSRRTLFKTMSLLRRYALSDAAVGFEVLGGVADEHVPVIRAVPAAHQTRTAIRGLVEVAFDEAGIVRVDEIDAG